MTGKMLAALFILILSGFLPFATMAQSVPDKEEWQPLFNGKDIKDWIPKINHHETGENYANTFRVEDGIMKVRYDQYDNFNEQFGHLYYKTPFSYYKLVVEYRFTGIWRKDAPS